MGQPENNLRLNSRDKLLRVLVRMHDVHKKKIIRLTEVRSEQRNVFLQIRNQQVLLHRMQQGIALLSSPKGPKG